MTAQDLISESILPVKSSDKASLAMALMDEYKISHIPVVDNGEFLGLISESEILGLNSADIHILSILNSLSRIHVAENQHVFDVISAFASGKLSLLPVLDHSNHYLGSITLSTIVSFLADFLSVNTPGSLIVIEVNDKDYMLTEIAQIVESNDAKVLGMSIRSYPDSTKLDITLKLNRMNIEPVLQTFARYNYTVKASFSENSNSDGLMERFDSLLKYLNV